MANNKITVTDLDFDQIKANLKTYLQSQDQFSDYNFDGSGISVLLDILAYNTHYNALYTNLAINEMFLDSASKRDSVISIANNYGYLPQSRRCSVATISMRVGVGSSTTQTITIPKYTAFTASVDGYQYTFFNRDEITGNRLNEFYIFDAFDIYEGTAATEKFNATGNTQYILQNPNVDTSTLRVFVQPTADSLNLDTYKYSETIVGLTNTTKAFFVREVEGNKYEIRFGKNNLGAEPAPGSVVYIEYMVTNGEEANGLKLFSYNGPTLTGTPIITLESVSMNGSEIESNDEVKYNVSRKFRTQNRAVTAEDYIDIIKNDYTDIDTLNCWSGDELTPPQYGKIFIAVKPKSGPFLIPSEKTFIIENIIKPRAVIGVYPEIIDPIYNNLQIDCAIYYDPYSTNKSSADIINEVRTAILDYNNIYLKKFDGILRFSKFLQQIDDADSAILNNITTIHMRRAVDVIYSKFVKYEITLSNPIYNSGVPEEAIITNGFYIDNSDIVYYIDDDGIGNLRLFYYSADTYKKIFISEKYGTVDYDRGVITVNNMRVEGTVESDLEFIVIPHSNDIISKHDQLSLIDPSHLNITAIRETRVATRPFTNSR